jgi:hypothetical protein
MAVLATTVELQEQLIAQESELESREGALTAQENVLAASESTLGRVCTERDAECARAEAI